MDQLFQAAELERQHAHAWTEDDRGTANNLLVLWRHRRFLWRVFWITFVVAIVVALLLPKHYDAVTKIVPGENSNSSTGLLNKMGGGFSGLDPSTLLGLKTQGAFYVEVLKSRTLQDRLIQRFGLLARYRFCRWCPNTTYYGARKKLASFSSFEEDKKSGVITITVTDYEPQTAAEMANAYVEELNRLAASLNTSAAHREREFLEDRLKTTKQELDQASMELSQFSSKNFVMNPQNQQRSVMDATGRLEGELIAAETDLREKQQLYSDDNIRVTTLKARIGELQSQLRKLEGNLPGANSSRAPDSPYPSLRSLPGLNYRYVDLYRQVRIQESAYEFFTQQYEVAKLQEIKELPIVRVLDLAVAPERKAGPSRILVVLLSVSIALLLAAFWIIERHRWRQLPLDHTRRLLMAEVADTMKVSVRKLKR
ncbi:MAG TPA: Wzz/FepE/Etk N-terminal domain-containing protein [Verrucomicrobiae bacterium]|nr:Wzz/FepE/Etk N-terminal domain-containing protein [Verrucomicrobiae bacterium]